MTQTNKKINRWKSKKENENNTIKKLKSKEEGSNSNNIIKKI